MKSETARLRARNGAEAMLLGLKQSGVDYLFANAGTDFPPVIEALATLDAATIPQPVTVPHETASLAMAHGYYLVTGKAQATMVHVNVGLANAAMGVINAASDNIPVVVMSGRTPITESGRPGARVTPIQYGQEMYDQASLVSDVTKFHYEMRYPEQGGSLTARAAALAMAEPRGPVYISLPREPLMEEIPEALRDLPEAQPVPSPPQPDPAAIEIAARWLAEATSPLVICQRSDPDGRMAGELARFAERHAVGVVEPFTVRNVMAGAHQAFLGHDVKGPLAEADVVVVLDADIPWIERLHAPGGDKRIIHIGPDPLFQKMPVRGYRSDLAIVSDPAAAVAALSAAMPEPGPAIVERRGRLADISAARLKTMSDKADAGCASPMTAEWLSKCLSRVLGEDGVVFGELGVVPATMVPAGPNRIFNNPHSGGLGWALPAALGAQLASRHEGSDRLCVACIGDGSYIFANPVACHQIAEALELPILTIIKNNGMWNAVRRSVVNSYPQGAAAKANTMPLTSLEPAPDYLMVAAASRAHVEQVEHGADLPAALERAIHVIRTERRQAVLELRIAISDQH